MDLKIDWRSQEKSIMNLKVDLKLKCFKVPFTISLKK